jgi:hypothetical protein
MSNDKRKNHPPKTALPHDTPINKIGHKDTDTEITKKRFWRDWNPIEKFTFCIAVFTCIYSVFAALQWCEMKKTVDITDKSFRGDQRAWIGITKIDGVAEAGKPLNITVWFKNTGRTPAKNIDAAVVQEPVPATGVPNFALEDSVVRQSKPIIPPQGEFNMSLNDVITKPLDDKTFKSITSKETIVYIHGIVKYDDIFERHHWITYCYFIASDGHSYNAYKEHNDMDSD